MHRVLDEDATRTTYAASPAVSFMAETDGSASLHLHYPVSDVTAGHHVRVSFLEVFLWRWNYLELGTEIWNEEDVSFQVIEILDSELAAELTTGELGAEKAPEVQRRRHFRVTFDNHGTYDVLAAEVVVEAGGQLANGDVFAPDASFSFLTHGEDLPAIGLDYVTSGSASGRMKAAFDAVFDYRWCRVWLPPDVSGVAGERAPGHLTEVAESGWTERLLRTAAKYGYPLGDAPGAARAKADFRHFTISTPGGGFHDVVCLNATATVAWP